MKKQNIYFSCALLCVLFALGFAMYANENISWMIAAAVTAVLGAVSLGSGLQIHSKEQETQRENTQLRLEQRTNELFEQNKAVIEHAAEQVETVHTEMTMQLESSYTKLHEADAEQRNNMATMQKQAIQDMSDQQKEVFQILFYDCDQINQKQTQIVEMLTKLCRLQQDFKEFIEEYDAVKENLEKCTEQTERLEDASDKVIAAMQHQTVTIEKQCEAILAQYAEILGKYTNSLEKYAELTELDMKALQTVMNGVKS